MRSYHGTYSVSGTKVIESDDLKLITSMLENDLNWMASDPETWEALYSWEKDHTYWLLSYENPEMHGGGIKILNEISKEKAKDFQQRFR